MKTRLRDNQSLIVHIGLGKTGTTTLQNHVFPQLAEAGYLAFNPDDTQATLNRLAARSDYNGAVGGFDFTARPEGIILLSDERFIGWNPAFWTERCTQIEGLFGSSATILLSLRDPESYLRSMYQQQIHQGNVSRPQEFFLPEHMFRQYESITRVRLNEICNVDALDYVALVEELRVRFARVIVLPFPDLLDLEFLTHVADVNKDQLATLRDTLVRLPPKNPSYSNLAMRLTFLRERLLNALGLKTLGTHDRYRNLAAAEAGGTNRGWKRILWPLVTWRGLMQVTLPKLTGYKPYQLPPSIYRGTAYETNMAFFGRLKSAGLMDFKSSATAPPNDPVTDLDH